jgi:pimeloyl-ACP methyl ester carboxylesterase
MCALLLSVLGACSPPRAIEAIGVLNDIGSTTGATNQRPAQAEPRAVPVRYRGAAAGRTGDLFARDGARAGLVLIPGAAETGKDDPRLRAFARSLARAGFAVLVPEIETLRRLLVRPEDADEIADAVEYLSRRLAGNGTAQIGIAAISYAAGPAVLAALDPRVREKVGFVIAVGGYYDIDAVVTYFTTGNFRDRPEQPWRYQRPNVYGKWVFVRSNLPRVNDEADRRLLRVISNRKLADPDADTTAFEARLGPEGRGIMALLTNTNPDAVPRLISALPAKIRRDMAGLDLDRRDLSALTANLILIHGRDDKIIPFTESAALAAAAPAGKASLYLVDGLAHVDLRPSGLTDALTLWRAVYRLLEERDRIAEGR